MSYEGTSHNNAYVTPIYKHDKPVIIDWKRDFNNQVSTIGGNMHNRCIIATKCLTSINSVPKCLTLELPVVIMPKE